MTEAATSRHLVDVGIPTRGRPRYLVEALETVLAQTESRWRATISENDAGDDAVAAALAPYLDDPRIEHSPTGRDIGQAPNHTRLLQAATAPYLAILHDDDRWEPRFLERRVAFLEEHPEAAFVCSPAISIDSGGAVLGRFEPDLPEGALPPADVLPKLLVANIVGVPSNALIRTSAARQVGNTFDDRFLYWDWEQWMRLAVRFPVGYVHSWDSAVRVHDSQVTFTHWPDREEILRLLDHFEELVRTHQPGLQLDPKPLARKRAAVLLSAALDSVERAERRGALGYALRARSVYPRSAANTKMLALLAALPLGRRGRSLLKKIRYWIFRKSIRVHLRARD